MLQFKAFGIQVKLSFLFFAVVTVYLILDRSGMGYCGVLAAVTHELGHMIAYFIVGERPKSVTLSIEGMRITSSDRYLTMGKDIFALSAGCFTNFTVFLLLYFGMDPNLEMTQIALVQLSIGLFNLVPVGALDGGMILKRFLSQLLPLKAAGLICTFLSWFIVLPVFGYGVLLLFRDHNITLMITAAFLMMSLIQDRRV
ncbi:MAG: hypothetical protein HFJ85_00140 [Oscillospiraceae bacterium]|nr:hypothetical protein [Oscillospiraceae bacterium]